MKRYALLLALLLAGVLVTAASPSPSEDIEYCRTSLQWSPGDRPARARDLDLRVSFGKVPNDPPQVLWVLSVRNRTDKSLTLTFPSTTYAGVQVRHRNRTLYCRCRGGFAAVTYRVLAPHERYVCTLGPEPFELGQLEPGRYDVIAGLATYPPPIRTRRSFSVAER